MATTTISTYEITVAMKLRPRNRQKRACMAAHGQHRDNLPYLKMGHERGLGTMLWENLRVKEV